MSYSYQNIRYSPCDQINMILAQTDEQNKVENPEICANLIKGKGSITIQWQMG